MGRKSTKENKTLYQLKREEMELSREKASELTHISKDRIESIENDEFVIPRPDEVLIMSDIYKHPKLCNYYCSHECSIGQQYVPEIDDSDNLFEIIVKTVDSINKVDDQKDRLLEIIADGIIDDDELKDFVEIQEQLEKVSINVERLQIWMETQSDKNALDEKKIKAIREEIKKMQL